jgi:hypothetical protein
MLNRGRNGRVAGPGASSGWLVRATLSAFVLALSVLVPVSLATPALATPVKHLCVGLNGRRLPPAVTGVSPSFGRGSVTISGSCLGTTTKVMFGDQSAGFTTKNEFSVTATAPYGTPGSTVPVTVVADGQTSPSTATFSYPIGELDVDGPTAFDPYAGNDSDWYNGGGHSLTFSDPSTLVFGTYSPVFHVTTAFADTGNAEGSTDCYVYRFQPCAYLGDGATYSAGLQYCNVAVYSAPNSDGSCHNWDGIDHGTWTDVPNSEVSETLSDPGSGRTTFGDLAVPTGGLFSDQDLAYTFRVEATVAQTDSQNAAAEAYRVDSADSAPFNAVVIPSALVQLSVVPYTIIYQPPGDQSTVSYTTKAAFGTSYTLGNSNQQSNSFTSSSTESSQLSLSAGFGFGFNLNSAQNFDQSTKQTFGLTG